jgi:hypothetical protein
VVLVRPKARLVPGDAAEQQPRPRRGRHLAIRQVHGERPPCRGLDPARHLARRRRWSDALRLEIGDRARQRRRAVDELGQRGRRLDRGGDVVAIRLGDQLGAFPQLARDVPQADRGAEQPLGRRPVDGEDLRRVPRSNIERRAVARQQRREAERLTGTKHVDRLAAAPELDGASAHDRQRLGGRSALRQHERAVFVRRHRGRLQQLVPCVVIQFAERWMRAKQRQVVRRATPERRCYAVVSNAGRANTGRRAS